MSDARNRNPGPWTFHVHRHGLRHVIVDADGCHMVANVPIGSGPLLAAAPELLASLERITECAEPGSEAHEIALEAIERFREREAMIVTDWVSGSKPPRSALRVVGTAT